jgi:hypothetical protein
LGEYGLAVIYPVWQDELTSGLSHQNGVCEAAMASDDKNILLSHTAHADTSDAEGTPQAEHTHSINTWMLVKWLVGIILVLIVAVGGIIQLFQVVKLHQLKTTVEVDTLSHAEYLKHRQNMRNELSWGTEKAEYRAISPENVQLPIGTAMDEIVNNYNKQSGNLDGTLKHWANPVGGRGSQSEPAAPKKP